MRFGWQTVAWLGGVVLAAASCTRAPMAPTVPALALTGAGPSTGAVPSISGIVAQGRRPHEPANFADLSEVIDLTALVGNATGRETYEWSASLGRVEGSGPVVAWRAPAAASTPLDAMVALKISSSEGTTAASTMISLHDSPKELDGMARQFLIDFSNSRLKNVNAIMRNFAPGCYGTAEETAQVENNRQRFTILRWKVEAAATQVSFGGVCPFRARHGDACTSVKVEWHSFDFQTTGIGTVNGDDWLASFYVPAERRWRLCDSQFDGQQVGVTAFIQ
jgi:hypothetical protein